MNKKYNHSKDEIKHLKIWLKLYTVKDNVQYVKKIVPLIVLHRDANVSSSISFELLNLAVILRHLCGKTSEKTQVAAYFTEISGIAEWERMSFNIFSLLLQR